MEDTDKRQKEIIITSIVGIFFNLILVILKGIVGFITNSSAVISDAINNLSDALSSIITIVGIKLASLAPDKDHPLGHGRIEYISAFIIAIIILYAGVSQLVESINRFINKENAIYDKKALVILFIAIFIKIILSKFVKVRGEKLNSKSLIASGEDAKNDALISTAVFISAILNFYSDLNLENILSIFIAIYIMKSGLDLIKDAGSEIVGKRIDGSLSKAIKESIAEDERIYGAYDLYMTNYGPEKYVASVHIEVDENMKAKEIDDLTRETQEKIFKKFNVLLGTIGIYSINSSNDRYNRMKDDIRKICTSHDGILQIHGFYVNEKTNVITFDMVCDFKIKDLKKIKEHIKNDIEKRYIPYKVEITTDIDVSD